MVSCCIIDAVFWSTFYDLILVFIQQIFMTLMLPVAQLPLNEMSGLNRGKEESHLELFSHLFRHHWMILFWSQLLVHPQS